MSAEDAFVRNILDNPNDDVLRLVFADWLEENGRCSHAE
ncbi:MAG: TIGR02996 domain-containing protein, partial [Planctomycetaceae bacterium]|nr:TIGR02996 domain-containing protein [Planctomycetaceae bacterium]